MLLLCAQPLAPAKRGTSHDGGEKKPGERQGGKRFAERRTRFAQKTGQQAARRRRRQQTGEEQLLSGPSQKGKRNGGARLIQDGRGGKYPGKKNRTEATRTRDQKPTGEERDTADRARGRKAKSGTELFARRKGKSRPLGRGGQASLKKAGKTRESQRHVLRLLKREGGGGGLS